jgi:hypothetical protein
MNIVVLTAVLLGPASLKSRLATALSDVLKTAACMATQHDSVAYASVVCALQYTIYRFASGMHKG